MSKIKITSLNSECKLDDRSWVKYKELYVKSNEGRYVSWGRKDNQPEYILDLYTKSPLHSSIVRRKANMIGGNGFIETSTLGEFIKNSWGKEDLNDVLKRLSFDLANFNGFFLNIIWNEKRDYIAAINWISPFNIRIGEKIDGEPQHYIWCNDFNDRRELRIKYYEFEDLTTLSEEERLQKPASVIYYHNSNPIGNHLYPIPEWVAAEESIMTNGLVQTYHLHNIKTGFHPGHKIVFIGDIPSDEEKEEISRSINAKYQGASNATKSFIFYAEDKDSVPIIEPITLTDADKKYIEINKNLTDQILYAHEVTDPELFGIKIPGELGSSTDMQSKLDVFQSTYITPKQREIESVFNKFLQINGIDEGIKIGTYKIKVKVNVNVNDLITILNSTLHAETKKAMLSLIGYDDETIEKIIK